MYFKKWNDFKLINNVIINENTTTNQGTSADKPNGTNSNVKNISLMSDDELKTALSNWNAAYSQEFKFINNMPKEVKDDNTLEDLKSHIAEEYRAKVDEALKKFIEFLKNEKVSKSLKAIDIIGYTSTTGPVTGSLEYNQSLSERRAKIVANAIQNMIKQSKINIQLSINKKGEGKNPNYLIIANDQSLDPIIMGKNAPQLSPDILSKLEKSKEERQKINRRVRITLPNLTLPLETPKKITVEEVKKEEVKKPQPPTPTDITFNWDSFILTKEGQSVLSTFCENIKKYNESAKDDKKIKDLYISSHTKLGKDDGINSKKDRVIQEKMLVILSANRALFVRDFIRLKFGEEFAETITFHLYPTAFKMSSNEKKVVINFEKTEHMKTAETVFKELASTYNLQKNGELENLAYYFENDALLDIMKTNIKADIEESVEKPSKSIPLELAHDDLEGYYGFKKYATYRGKIQKELKNLIEKLNKKNNGDYSIEDFYYSAE
jgi:outer membrane protein OmpA-like peptidoglycan-associated protein